MTHSRAQSNNLTWLLLNQPHKSVSTLFCFRFWRLELQGWMALYQSIGSIQRYVPSDYYWEALRSLADGGGRQKWKTGDLFVIFRGKWNGDGTLIFRAMIIRHNKLNYGGDFLFIRKIRKFVDCDVHNSQWQRRSDPLSSLIVRGKVKRIFVRNDFKLNQA